VNMLSLEVGTNAEHRAGSPLTLAAMAGDHGIGIGGYFDTQGTATAMRGSPTEQSMCRRNPRSTASPPWCFPHANDPAILTEAAMDSSTPVSK